MTFVEIENGGGRASQCTSCSIIFLAFKISSGLNSGITPVEDPRRFMHQLKLVVGPGRLSFYMSRDCMQKHISVQDLRMCLEDYWCRLYFPPSNLSSYLCIRALSQQLHKRVCSVSLVTKEGQLSWARSLGQQFYLAPCLSH